MAADYSSASLAAAAVVDPWALARTVADGRPDEVHGVGAAFRTAQTRALEVARLGGVADRSTAVAYTNNGAGVWEVDAAARQTHGLLSQNGDDMADVGRAVIIVAEELASASSAVQKELTTLADQINGVLARRNAFFASAGPLAPEDLAAAERGFVDQAVGLVRGCAGRIQADLDAYDRVLASRTGFLADLGYEPLTAEAGPPVDRNATTTLAPGLTGSEVLRTPPGARLEGGLDRGVTIAVPAPGGGLVLGTPPAPDLGTARPIVGCFPSRCRTAAGF